MLALKRVEKYQEWNGIPHHQPHNGNTAIAAEWDETQQWQGRKESASALRCNLFVVIVIIIPIETIQGSQQEGSIFESRILVEPDSHVADPAERAHD